jgi:hypothetical protein
MAGFRRADPARFTNGIGVVLCAAWLTAPPRRFKVRFSCVRPSDLMCQIQ